MGKETKKTPGCAWCGSKEMVRKSKSFAASSKWAAQGGQCIDLRIETCAICGCPAETSDHPKEFRKFRKFSDGSWVRITYFWGKKIRELFTAPKVEPQASPLCEGEVKYGACIKCLEANEGCPKEMK